MAPILVKYLDYYELWAEFHLMKIGIYLFFRCLPTTKCDVGMRKVVHTSSYSIQFILIAWTCIAHLVLVWIDRQCQRIRRSLYEAFWFKAAWCSLLPPSCSNLEKQAVKYLLDFWRWWSPGLIVFLFKWNSPCLVMRSSWVVQGKHTFLFTSISNSVDDLFFANQFHFWFDSKFSVSQIFSTYFCTDILRTAFLWFDWSFSFHLVKPPLLPADAASLGVIVFDLFRLPGYDFMFMFSFLNKKVIGLWKMIHHYLQKI